MGFIQLMLNFVPYIYLKKNKKIDFFIINAYLINTYTYPIILLKWKKQ